MKQQLLSLLLAAVLLASASAPVRAAGSGGKETEPFSTIGALVIRPEENKPTPPSNADSGAADPSKEAPDALDEGTVAAGVSLVTDRHIAYAQGSGDEFAAFNPWQEVSRAEVAQMFFRLLPAGANLPPADFTDADSSAWYYEAVRTLGSVFSPGQSAFGPDETVSRGDFMRYIAAFFPLRTDAEPFSDVPESDPNAPYIRSARAYGWALGTSDGLFQPENPVTRAEAVVFLNRALGRSADKSYISQKHPAFYTDVSPDHWFYYDVMEASLAHEYRTDNETGGETWTSHTPRAAAPNTGLHLVDGWLYYYDAAKGDILRSGEAAGHTFDAAGHFTSGDAGLDGKLRNIVLSQTNSSMSQEEMLRALYVYTRDSFAYLRGPAYDFGATGFMVEDALRILDTGYGNCYCYASLFWFLSRWIGYDSVIYSGVVGQNQAPHSWVEIVFDGTSYIFDTELEMAYHRKNRYDIDLYKFIDTEGKWDYVRP